MKQMKWFFSVILLVAVSLSLVSCQSQGGEEDAVVSSIFAPVKVDGIQLENGGDSEDVVMNITKHTFKKDTLSLTLLVQNATLQTLQFTGDYRLEKQSGSDWTEMETKDGDLYETLYLPLASEKEQSYEIDLTKLVSELKKGSYRLSISYRKEHTLAQGAPGKVSPTEWVWVTFKK